jgi:uncharacterized protein with PQ loop repeat
MSTIAENTTILDTTKSILNIVFDISFVFLPLVGYVAQLLKIRNLKSSVGFSKFISFILINAFLFRIFFWFGNHYKLTIFFQSIVGLIFQIVLLQQCIKYTEFKDKSKSDLFNFNEFWNWPYFMDYVVCLVFIASFISLSSFTFGYGNTAYVEFLGYMSGLIEATLGVPQVISNYRTKNTKGFSLVLIGTWVAGDSVKLFYFINSGSPVQLIISAICQLCVDFIIVIQMWYYNSTDTKPLQ